MKILARVLLVLVLVIGCFGFLNSQSALADGGQYQNAVDLKLTTEYGKKIDLNNSDIRDFRDLRGFYPNLAGLIIKNAPYSDVKEVLAIPSLNEKQKARLQANLDNFTVTEPSIELIEGGDRFNPGVY